MSILIFSSELIIFMRIKGSWCSQAVFNIDFLQLQYKRYQQF